MQTDPQTRPTRRREPPTEHEPWAMIDAWLYLHELSKLAVVEPGKAPEPVFGAELERHKRGIFLALEPVEQAQAMAVMGPHEHAVALLAIRARSGH